MSKNFHERFSAEVGPMPSESSTGLVFTAVAMIVAVLWRNDQTILVSALAVGGVLLAVSLLVPHLLRPLNIIWFKFALLLNKIVSPLVMLVLFVVAIIPFGLAMQLCRDPLRKRRSEAADSYWIKRDAATEQPGDMAQQF